MASSNGAGVGELLVLGFRGRQVPDWLCELSREFGLGGIILFDYDCQTRTYQNNIHTKEQLKELCSELHELSSKPLICVDQEGGKVRRLKEKLGFAALPSAAQMAKLPEAEASRALHASYRELRELGIDWNLAPVIDLNLNPKNPDIGAIERSYSDEPEQVRKQAHLAARAAREAGIALCLKHYPGLGGATTNSHEELTDLSDSVDERQLQLFYELAPVIPGEAVLVSHGIVSAWDRDRPLSTSPAAMGRLREHLPDALLVTDDLQMQGLQARSSTREATRDAIVAGVDQVIIGNNLIDEQEEMLALAESLAREASRNPRFASRVSESRERVARRKAEFLR